MLLQWQGSKRVPGVELSLPAEAESQADPGTWPGHQSLIHIHCFPSRCTAGTLGFRSAARIMTKKPVSTQNNADQRRVTFE